MGFGSFAAVPGPVGFDFYTAGFAGEVVAIAAVGPVFGIFYKAFRYWIAMDVAELFHEFLVGEDVEVVIARLPELLEVALEVFGGFTFEDGEGCRQDVLFGFAEKQVNMVGHDDVAEEIEVMSAAELFEGFFEDDAGVIVCQQRLLAIAGEVDGVVVVVFLKTCEADGHRGDFSVRLGVGCKEVRVWVGCLWRRVGLEVVGVVAVRAFLLAPPMRW